MSALPYPQNRRKHPHRQNLLNTFFRLRPGPEISPKIHIKRNNRPILLKLPDHLHCRIPGILRQRQCDPAGMETPGACKHLLRQLFHPNLTERRMPPVINHTWFPGICSVFIIIDTQPCIRLLVIHQIVITDSAERTCSCINTQSIIRQLGYDSCPEAQRDVPDTTFNSAPPPASEMSHRARFSHYPVGDSLSKISPNESKSKSFFHLKTLLDSLNLSLTINLLSHPICFSREYFPNDLLL